MAMKKILVIDYDQNSLAALQGTLSKEGYEVVTATDGQAGWDKYNKESPDLVLMEAMLPKVHGFELCQRITSERNSQATVFIMTGVYKDRVYRTEALRTYGASEYFEKPLKMAELLSSIEAVLGKPEPRPEPEPEPVRVVRPEAVMVEARKREKSKSDEDQFSLPADLDQLAREIPKIRKPTSARREATTEARFESLADELLKSVVVESVPEPKKPGERTGGGNGNGNGRDSTDIDQFLKSALAGLEIEKDKVKVPKPVPQPPVPPAPAAEKPIVEKPVVAKPIVEKPAFEKPVIEKPKPAPVPEFGFSMPEPAMKNTLTPGDPGSDISPFFSPVKPKPQAPPEAPKAHAPVPPAMPAASARPVLRPVEKPKIELVRPEPLKREPFRTEPPRHEQARHEPAKHEPAKDEPVRTEVKIPGIAPTPSGDIFQHQEIFEHVGEGKEKKGFPKIVFVALGVAAVAVAAFIVLRPKPAPKPDPNLVASQTMTEAEVPAQPIVEAPPPEVKSEPVKPKPKPAAKKAEPAAPVAEGIVDPIVSAGVLALTPATTEGKDGAPEAASNLQTQADASAAKTGESAPPAKSEAEPPSTAVTETPKTGDPGFSVIPPPAAVPAKEGDLVDLGSVTSPPTLVKKVNPVYPPGAQQRGLEGSITVNALIDEKGNVIDTGILKGIQDDMGLGKAAETAVRKWKFEPARKDGVAVKVWKSFVIAFKAGKASSGTSE
jgi:TonB family protein